MANILQRRIQRVQAITRPVSGQGLVSLPTTLPSGRPMHLRGLTRPYTVTNVSTQLAPPDYDRKQLFMQNNDALGDVWVSFGASAVLGVGMKLGANGGGILLDTNVPTAEINVIGTIASNPNVSVITA